MDDLETFRQEVRAWLAARELPAFTPYTVTDAKAFRAVLAQVRTVQSEPASPGSVTMNARAMMASAALSPCPIAGNACQSEYRLASDPCALQAEQKQDWPPSALEPIKPACSPHSWP